MHPTSLAERFTFNITWLRSGNSFRFDHAVDNPVDSSELQRSDEGPESPSWSKFSRIFPVHVLWSRRSVEIVEGTPPADPSRIVAGKGSE